MNIRDLINVDELDAAVNAGHVRVVNHPTLPYRLYGYTDAAVWAQAWTPVTLACRGLIVHADTGEIIARPFRKFFNSNESHAPTIDLDTPVIIMDKVDGSLAISYPDSTGQLLVATRGSFTSDQAVWATDYYTRTYHGRWQPDPDHTYLWEIVYPENRVVLDYGDLEDIILLGAVHIPTGRTVHPDTVVTMTGWPGPTVATMPHTTLRHALTDLNRENAEGFVVWDPETDERVKVKQDDYLRLHKLLSNLTERSVWEVLAAGMDPMDSLADLPDEFHAWTLTVINRLTAEYDNWVRELTGQYLHLRAELDDTHPHGWGRKEFADKAKNTPYPSMMFALLDGDGVVTQRVVDWIWRETKPGPVRATGSTGDE